MVPQLRRTRHHLPVWDIQPSAEFGIFEPCCLHRHQVGAPTTRVLNALHAIALGMVCSADTRVESRDAQAILAALPLPLHVAQRRDELNVGVETADVVRDDPPDVGEDETLRHPFSKICLYTRLNDAK